MPLKKIGRAIKKTVRKIVPKEVAGIMQVAAPFVAPTSLPGALALSLGGQLRSGQGRINPFSTLAAIAPSQQFRSFTRSSIPGGLKFDEFLYGTGADYGVDATQGILGTGGKFGVKEFMGSSLLSPMKNGVPTLSKARVAGLVAAGATLATTQQQIEEEGEEVGLPSDEITRLQAEAAEMWEDFDTTAFKPNVKDGGLMRTKFAMGSKGEGDELPPDPTTPVNPFKPKPIGPVLPNKKMAEFDIGEYFELFEEANPQFKGMDRNSDEYRFYFNDYWQGLANKKQEGDTMMAEAVDVDILRQMFMEALKNGEIPPGTDFDTYKDMMMTLMSKTQAKKGGLMRTNYALGTEPTSEESGLGGLPIEADMRYSGGFMPYGAKEKADDVPARLSKNEFVFTADAVRAAGGGSVQKGAQKMYNSMKQLEAMGRRMA